MRKGYALNRNKEKRFEFEIDDKPRLVYEIKITSGDHKGETSYIFEDELDEYIVLEDNKTEGKY